MFTIGKVTQGATCVLISLIVGMVLATDQKKVTWEKCTKWTNETRVLGTLPDTQAQELFVADCELTTIHAEDFDGLPNLEELSLEYNNLTDIDTNVFKSLTNLNSLFLHFNQFDVLPNFGEDSTLLPNLILIQIDSNQITQLDDPKKISSLAKLRVFSAADNYIEYIHEDMFKKLPIFSIYLSGNKLKYIPEKLFQLSTLKTLLLANNLIEYIPKDSFRGSAITELQIQDNRITYLQDAFLSQFPGGTLHRLRCERNSWHCSCLNDLLEEIKSAGVSKYHAEYYNSTRNVCIVSELKCNRDHFYPSLDHMSTTIDPDTALNTVKTRDTSIKLSTHYSDED